MFETLLSRSRDKTKDVSNAVSCTFGSLGSSTARRGRRYADFGSTFCPSIMSSFLLIKRSKKGTLESWKYEVVSASRSEESE